jgi:hypothetical protein
VAAEAVRQCGQQRALAQPSRPFLQIVGEEPVATDRHDA